MLKAILLLIAVTAAPVMSARPAAPQDEAQDEERGERLMNRYCLDCHDIRRVQVQALDEANWIETVTAMIEKGAMVQTEDLPTLIDYLARNHGPVPDGEGKSILLNTCTRCHDLKRIKEHGATRRQWAETLLSMLNEGAPLSDEELPIILEYLATSFPPTNR